MVGNKVKQESIVDLLDLPVSERTRLCGEIRAALKERVAVGNIPVADDAIIADESMLRDAEMDERLWAHQNAVELPANSSLISNLLKRVW